MVEIISSNEKKIKKIFHISDIHIRLYKRKEEYLHCFQKLYEEIYKYPREENIIVITGDILHNKLEMSPECETMTFDFLEKLSLIYPTFFILGNHDTLLNNRNRLDSLSSIIYKRDLKNLYYLKYTNIYQYENILFYVDSLLDEKTIDMKNVKNNKINIGLYHGGIRGWKNSKGYISESGEKYIEDFSGMDYVLLGDIHLYQYMSKEKPIMAYPGSLISQNFGETDPNHGMLIWDLETGKQEFKIIENPYRFQDVYIVSRERVKTDNKEYDIEKVELPPKGNIKLYGMENEIESKLILQKLQTLWKDIIFSFQSYEENTKIEGKQEIKDTEEEMIEYYLKENLDEKYYDDIRDEIMKIWRDRNQYYSSMQWSIKKISFSNLFGYGEKNSIVFPDEQKNNIIGIFGNNSVGKSTIIDIISLLLFDKLTRFPHGQSIPKEVIHFAEKEGYGCIELKIGGDLYNIKKKYKRQTNGKIKQQTNFYCIKDNISIELTEEQRNKTNQIIREIIGSPDIFIYIHSFLQQREQSFRELTSSNKKKFLNELNGYSWFEKIEKERKENIKKLETKQDVLSSLIVSPFDNEILKNELEELKQKNQIYNEKIEEIDETINLKYESLYVIKDDILLEKQEKNLKDILLLNIKKKENDDIFMKKWEKYIDNFTNISMNNIFQEWNTKRTKEEWKLYKKEMEKIFSINFKEELEKLYQLYSNENIEISIQIINLYNRKEKTKIVDEFYKLKNIPFEIELKKKYNNLYHSYEDIENQDYYLEKEKEFYKEWKKYEKECSILNEYYIIYEKYKMLIDEENISEYIKEGILYQNDPFYQSYSIFFERDEIKFQQLLKRIELLDCNKIRSEIDLIEKELRSIEIPYLTRKYDIKEDEYDKLKNDIKKKYYKCENCSFEITDNLIDKLKELDEIETDKYLLMSEMDVLKNNIKECNFIPNPKCEVCLKNPNYIIKKRSEKKQEEKRKELININRKEKKILNELEKETKGTKDVHLKEIEYSLDFFYKVKKEKEKCRKREEKERKEYEEKIEMVKEYELHRRKLEQETKRNKIEENLKKYKKDLDFLLSMYEKRNIIEYIKKEWKRKTILPKRFLELESVFLKFKENFREEEYKENIKKRDEYKKKWDEFKENWEKDIIYKGDIEELENRYMKKERYRKWIEEIQKLERREKMNEIKNEIEYYKEKEIEYNEWKNNEEIYKLIDMCWEEEFDSINIIKEKLEEIKKRSLEIELFNLEKDLNIVKKERKENKENTEKNGRKEEEIELLRKEKNEVKKEKEKTEERMIELKLNIKRREERKKENEDRIKEVMEIKEKIKREKIVLRMIDKDGLPLYLLVKKMEPMERQMNELISPFLPDKKIRFFIDQKTIEFGTFLSEKENLCNYFGGMESFIIDLSLKLTFAKYGNLPRSNFFIIDEGISVLDSERIYNISYLFSFLSNITSNVLLISHIPQIKDFVDKEIIIEKKNEKSFIYYH